eukprot:269726_1
MVFTDEMNMQIINGLQLRVVPNDDSIRGETLTQFIKYYNSKYFNINQLVIINHIIKSKWYIANQMVQILKYNLIIELINYQSIQLLLLLVVVIICMQLTAARKNFDWFQAVLVLGIYF